jgi:TonB family protein
VRWQIQGQYRTRAAAAGGVAARHRAASHDAAQEPGSIETTQVRRTAGEPLFNSLLEHYHYLGSSSWEGGRMVAFRFPATLLVAGLVAAAAPPAADEPVLRTPAMPEWKLLHKVDPEYPSAALQHRIQGAVRFTASIGKDGHVERLRLISGHPLLVGAAREAAQQWMYRPTLWADKPVRVMTQIAIHFRLDPYGKPSKDDNPGSNRRAAIRSAQAERCPHSGWSGRPYRRLLASST